MDIWLLALTCALVPLGIGEKILYMPFPSYKSLQTGTRLKDDLQLYGHELWIAYPQFLKSRDILKGNKSHYIKYQSLGDINVDEIINVPKMKYFLEYEDYQESLPDYYKTISGNILDILYQTLSPGSDPLFVIDKIQDLNQMIRDDKSLLEVIKQEKFDLVIEDEMLDYHFMLTELGIPFCVLGEYIDPWLSGNLISPAHIPATGSSFTDNMSLFQRVYNTIIHGFRMFEKSRSLGMKQSREISAEDSPGAVDEAKLWLITQDVLVDYSRPAMPSTKYVGGLTVRESKPLRGKFKELYAKASDGVIVVSFGEGIINLETSIVEKLFKAFRNTNYLFVISLNITSPDKSKFITSRYIPKNDLLGSPKTKLFITDCDINDQYESLSHGVPMLCIPVTEDKDYEAIRLEQKGYGLHLDLLDSTAYDITRTIEGMLETQSFKNAAGKAANILKDRPWSASKEASYWINHVIKYGDSHFRSTNLHLPWYKYFCVDVTIVLGSLIIFGMWLISAFVKWSLPGFFRDKDSPKAKND